MTGVYRGHDLFILRFLMSSENFDTPKIQIKQDIRKYKIKINEMVNVRGTFVVTDVVK